MPLSRYLTIWPSRDREGHFLLYSTKKSAAVRVSPALLAAARSDTLTDSERSTLSRLEVWTDDPDGEREKMRAALVRSNERSRQFTATVVLNLDCNLACPYCYEAPFRGREYMAHETASLFVDLVIRDQIGRDRDVEINFYGGEPLLSVPRIREIARPLQYAARARGTQFSFFLFTNGVLLDRPLVEELVPLGLTGALVTLDGPQEIHDRQRPFVSGKGSFDRIVANLREVSDLIDIQLNGNYTGENYREFPRLLDVLLNEGITPDRLKKVQFSPVTHKSSPTAFIDGHSGCAPADNACIMTAAPFLREEILRRGYHIPKPVMAACAVEFDGYLVVNHDGSLYKCPAFMGWPELAIGTLAAGIRDYAASHNLDVWKNDTCLDCAYLPICFGGCRLNPLLEEGVIDRVDCRRPFYDANLETIVLLDRKYRPAGN
jgi:uncharacterized protein